MWNTLNPFDFGLGAGGDGTMPDFSAAGPGATPQPLPEEIANHLAMKGVSPGQFFANPQQFLTQHEPMRLPPAASGTAQPGFMFGGGKPPPSVGVSLAPAQQDYGLDSAQPSKTEVATSEASAKSAQPSTTDKLLATLKGVQAPPAPTAQRVYTPNANVPNVHGGVKGGNIAALLQLLNVAGQSKPQIPLPLGAVLAGRT